MGNCRLKEQQLPFGEPFVPTGHEMKTGMNRMHMLSLLPTLCQAAGVDALLQTGADYELCDLLAFWRGKMDVVVATLPLSDAALHSTSEKQPQLCVLVDSPSHGMVLYSGLWVHFKHGERHVSWLADPAKLENATAKIVGSLGLGRALYQSSIIPTEPCCGPAEALVEWLRPPVEPKASLVRFEEKHGSRVVLQIPDDMWAQVKAGAKPEVVARRGCGLLAVGAKKRAKVFIDIQFPTPVAMGDVQLSRSRRELTLFVPRGVYGFNSVAPSELRLDDLDAWPIVNVPEMFMVTCSGMQMSEEEKYIARSRGVDDVLPLIAVKESLTVIFQHQDTIRFVLHTEKKGGVALLLLHGIRREHRYGTIAADLSFCFLTHDILDDVIPWWQSSLRDSGSKSRTIVVTDNECALMLQFVKLLAARSKDTASWKKPPGRGGVPVHLRKHFIRVLCPPLFVPESVLARMLPNDVLSEKRGLESTMRALKEQGAQLVKKRRHADAISSYQRAIMKYNQKPSSSNAASHLAAQCYLNIALCVLEPQDPDTAREAIVSCDRALEIISSITGGDMTNLVTKAHYRKGQVLELRGDAKAAEKAFIAATKLSPSDEIISNALARVRLDRMST